MNGYWMDDARETLINYGYMKKNIECICRLLERGNSPEMADRLRRMAASIRSTEQALSYLSEEQYNVLDEFFITGLPGYVERLCRKYTCQKSAVYRVRNDALKLFYFYRFGTPTDSRRRQML